MNSNILESLLKANEKLKEFDISVELVVVGGSGFVLKGALSRVTHDIDVINIIDDEAMKVLNNFEINDRVRTFETTFGEWENDLELLEFENMSNIKLMTISIERLLASRIFSRKRLEDFIAIFKDDKIDINKNKFEEIIYELLEFNDPIFKNEAKGNIEIIKECYSKRGWDETKIYEKLCNW